MEIKMKNIDEEYPAELRNKASKLYRESINCVKPAELDYYTQQLSSLKCAPFIYFFAKNKKEYLTEGQIDILYRSIIFTSNMDYITKFIKEIEPNCDTHNEL